MVNHWRPLNSPTHNHRCQKPSHRHIFLRDPLMVLINLFILWFCNEPILEMLLCWEEEFTSSILMVCSWWLLEWLSKCKIQLDATMSEGHCLRSSRLTRGSTSVKSSAISLLSLDQMKIHAFTAASCSSSSLIDPKEFDRTSACNHAYDKWSWFSYYRLYHLSIFCTHWTVCFLTFIFQSFGH